MEPFEELRKILHELINSARRLAALELQKYKGRLTQEQKEKNEKEIEENLSIY